MTASTLPLVAGLSYDGHPAYPARAILGDPDAENVVWFPHPAIPAGLAHAYRWATDAEVRSPHVALDVAAVSELLYHDLAADPDGLDDEHALAVLAAQLDAVHCDMVRCCADVAADIADHPDSGRYSRCVRRAARLLEVAP